MAAVRHTDHRQLMADYGCDITRPVGVARYARALRGMSRRRYVETVQRILRHTGDYVPRSVIAAVWRSPAVRPSEWADPDGRGLSWVGYWRATQARPGRPGSPYCDDPDAVARAWALGVPADAYPHGWAHLLPEVGRDTPRRQRRIDALVRIGRRLRGRLKHARTYLPQYIRTADLRRLSRLSGGALVALAAGDGLYDLTDQAGNVDWPRLHAQLRAHADRTARRGGVPSCLWLRADDIARERAAAIAAARDQGVPWRWVEGAWRDRARARAWGTLAKAGLARRMAHIEWDAPAGPPDDIVRALADAASAGWTPPTEAWLSRHHLVESLEAAGYMSAPLAQQAQPRPRTADDDVASARRRWADLRAQVDPDWAIDQWRVEYGRGQRIAPVLGEVLDHLVELARDGATLLVHGRDAELVWHLLSRRGVRAAYAITSRPLTTHGGQPRGEYLAYLQRVVPRSAVHVDTGCVGSIPQWFATHGWTVEQIRLVSAVDPENQIPVSPAALQAARSASLRTLVLADLEHSPQRLVRPATWGRISYAEGAPGYWARLYGVCDALGLPRQDRSRWTRRHRRALRRLR